MKILRIHIISILVIIVHPFSAQNIYTYAGTGNPGYSGDGGSALLAELKAPTGIVTDKKGNVYFCEWYWGRIRKINYLGIITTIAGGGTDLNNGIPATTALVRHPWGLTIDSVGNLYFAEAQQNQVRKIDTLGIITTIAGVAGMTGGFYGDGGLATNARFNLPSDVAIDKLGNIYIADAYNQRIRMVNTSGIITTIAGSSSIGSSGDGGLAINATLNYPLGLATDRDNTIYIGDVGNYKIRKIDNTGIITTFCGTGIQGNTGDGGLATNAKMGETRGLEVDSLGNLFFADRYYGVVRKVDSNGIITSIAGTGLPGYSGDGGAAILAQIDPIDVTFDSFGNLYITDNGNERIRKVCGTQPLSVITSTSTSCAAESVTLSVSGTNTYTWSTGSANASVIVTPTVTTTYTVNGADMVGCSYNAVFIQSVNACVGIREYEMDEIKIYPNPTTNLLQISDENNVFKNSTIEITNYLGQTIIKQAYSNTVDVSKLPIGIYTLKILTLDKERFYSMFIKE